MISVRDAFGRETTSKIQMCVVIAGYWDADNQWVHGGFAPALNFQATPIPVGDFSGTHGESLTPDPYGERTPAMMRFTSRLEMPMNSVILHGDIPYKVTRRGDYRTGGYWQSIGQTLPRFDPNNIDPTGYEIDEGLIFLLDKNGVPITSDDTDVLSQINLKYGAREVPLSQLLEAQNRG